MTYIYNADRITVPEVAMVHMGACCVAAVQRRRYSVIPDAWEVLRCEECNEKCFRWELSETKNGSRLCETCEQEAV